MYGSSPRCEKEEEGRRRRRRRREEEGGGKREERAPGSTKTFHLANKIALEESLSQYMDDTVNSLQVSMSALKLVNR